MWKLTVASSFPIFGAAIVLIGVILCIYRRRKFQQQKRKEKKRKAELRAMLSREEVTVLELSSATVEPLATSLSATANQPITSQSQSTMPLAEPESDNLPHRTANPPYRNRPITNFGVHTGRLDFSRPTAPITVYRPSRSQLTTGQTGSITSPDRERALLEDLLPGSRSITHPSAPWTNIPLSGNRTAANRRHSAGETIISRFLRNHPFAASTTNPTIPSAPPADLLLPINQPSRNQPITDPTAPPAYVSLDGNRATASRAISGQSTPNRSSAASRITASRFNPTASTSELVPLSIRIDASDPLLPPPHYEDVMANSQPDLLAGQHSQSNPPPYHVAIQHSASCENVSRSGRNTHHNHRHFLQTFL